MAQKDWLLKIVNTQGRPCPLMGDKCPGHEAGCAFWVTLLIGNGTQDQDVVPGCLMAWNFVETHEALVEQIRTAATIDKASQHVSRAALGLARAGALKAQAEALKSLGE